LETRIHFIQDQGCPGDRLPNLIKTVFLESLNQVEGGESHDGIDDLGNIQAQAGGVETIASGEFIAKIRLKRTGTGRRCDLSLHSPARLSGQAGKGLPAQAQGDIADIEFGDIIDVVIFAHHRQGKTQAQVVQHAVVDG
jgi:hypothetical protein